MNGGVMGDSGVDERVDNDDDADDVCMYARKVVETTLQSKGKFGIAMRVVDGITKVRVGRNKGIQIRDG
jgi:hypothetical protein